MLVRRTNLVATRLDAESLLRGTDSLPDAVTIPVTELCSKDGPYRKLFSRASRRGVEIFAFVEHVAQHRLLGPDVSGGLSGIVTRVQDKNDLEEWSTAITLLRENLEVTIQLELLPILVGSNAIWHVQSVAALDFVRQLAIREPPSDETIYDRIGFIRSHMATSASAFCKQAVGVLPRLSCGLDEEVERQSLLEERELRLTTLSLLGYQGFICHDLRDVTVANKVLTPQFEDVDYARRVRQVLTEAEQSGRGATLLDGRMVDHPSGLWADYVLRLASACEERDRKKGLL